MHSRFGGSSGRKKSVYILLVSMLMMVKISPCPAQNFEWNSIPRVGISDSILKQSFTYAVKGNDSLGLDIYTLKGTDSSGKKPAVIFMFGGAFAVGERDDSIYNAYFNRLVENHYAVVSISYRLGLKGVRNVSKFNVKPLKKAVDMAVEDCFDATSWLVSRAGSFGIDTSKIILSGSSAGAISVLTADFEKSNDYPSSRKLPDGFKYAAVISFSGAILSLDGKLKYKHPPAPKLMFHGSSDKIVPYKKIRFLNKGFYGSYWIAQVSRDDHFPYYFYSEEGLGHEVSILPMFNRIPVILNFIDSFVVQGKPYEVDMYFRDPGQKPAMLLTSEELMKKLNK